MTKYLVFAEGQKKPVRKFKNEYDAISFISDVRRLSEYGCMSLKMETDGASFVWDEALSDWRDDN